ncbi:hypothetical protein HaLaN_30100, partial [Haematococcus lacustris]
MPSSGCIVASNAWWHRAGPNSSSRPSSGGQTASSHWPMGQQTSAAATPSLIEIYTCILPCILDQPCPIGLKF